MLRTSTRSWTISRPVSTRLGSLFRSYHSETHPNTIVDEKSVESRILTKAIEFIPEHGFHQNTITQAIRALGYPDSLQSVITNSSNSPDFSLVLHWLKVQRQKLEQHLVDPTSEFHTIKDEYERVAYAIKKRLQYNGPIINQLGSGLSHLVVPYNVSQSLAELHSLSDDIAFYAGDMSHDLAWYTKRVGFSSIYVSSELYQLQDSSEGFRRTNAFVDEKVHGLKRLGSAYNDVEQWGVFNAISTVNLIKSQLLRG
ncbi:hypothetical protein PICST_66543 [Scheffersomyces stipitis CBS 6054]|uniref:Ubiquinone biosynthesis protein n=1 Tax=Scheffersomyces stipitis (strain ATCC 58785 / CBS 6054 / NBRC 10063 / NRRL Y-11545) TaxID=322104 RepID=A3GGY4_PICST|nr:predicted protein [Scheffersomyces stipitis CBS 6054]EAZ64002.2 hypothetical protein PICST_66543 [Scheffersomyces stipitis CBS 6054]KAG2735324.1 hypothetical protein G9P44_001538 [Scheffersomyces stipitis]